MGFGIAECHNKKIRSRPLFGTRACEYASWCHPNSGAVRPFDLLLREGNRPRLRGRW